MTAGEYENRPQMDKISGDSTEVHIINPAQWSLLLEKGGFHSILRLSGDDLSEGCRDASITMLPGDERNERSIFSGSINFVLPDDGTDLTGWQDALLQEISDRIEHTSEATVAAIPNARQTVTVRLDHDFEVGLSIVEDLDDFVVTLVTYYRPVDEGAKHRPLPTSQYSLLRNYLQVYTSAINGIKALHGDHQPTIIPLQPITTQTAAEEIEATETKLVDYNEHTAPRRTLDSLGGLTSPKAELRRIINALKYPDLAHFYDLGPTHFLLHGPAGTGKTSLVEAFSEEIDAILIATSSSKIIDKWVGSSGRNIQELFDEAKKASSRVVLFFDEFESLAPKNDGSNERADVKNIVKQQLIKLSAKHSNIIVAAATNLTPDDFDESIIRAGRLKPIYVGKPTEIERADIWTVVLIEQQDRTGSLRPELYTEKHRKKGAGRLYADINPQELASATDGLTGADIKAVLQSAHFAAFAQAVAIGRTVPITQHDILAAIRGYQKP